MKFSLETITKYGFNLRQLTEQDFYAICETENIHVLEMDISTSFYMTVLGESTIVLSKRLKGLKRVFTTFHELSHHFLHGGRDAEEAFFFGMTESKQEIEADAMATIALVPRHMLNSYDFLEDHPNRYARQIFKNRQKLEFLYGI